MLINHNFTHDRTKYLGGSDIGAILGLSKFRTPLEVWLEKTGKANDKADSLPLRFGSFAEEFVASEYSRSTGYKLIKDEVMRLHAEYSFMGAHVDRYVIGQDNNSPPERILECKTANPFSTADWGEAGSDQVPLSYLCQCVWYMAITGIPQTDLAVLFGNNDFRIYHIPHDADLEELIIQKASHFWQEYVLKDQPPPTKSESDCQLLFRKGDRTKTAEATNEIMTLINRFQVLNHEIQIHEDEVSSLKQAIMNHMGEAESLRYQGKIVATWKAPKPSERIDTKRLEAEHPQLCATYKAPIQSSRRFVIKPII